MPITLVLIIDIVALIGGKFLLVFCFFSSVNVLSHITLLSATAVLALITAGIVVRMVPVGTVKAGSASHHKI